MKVYFDGCSWTYGAENDLSDRFSTVLCNKMGAEEINVSQNGASNRAILRRTLVENNISDYDLAVIQLTMPNRTEYWNVKVGKWTRVGINRFIHKSNLKKDYIDMGDEILNFWRFYHKNVYTDELGEIDEKVTYTAIKSHCNANNVPLILTTIRAWPFSELPYDMNLNDPKIPRARHNHPNKEGHAMIANNLYNKIYENLL